VAVPPVAVPPAAAPGADELDAELDVVAVDDEVVDVAEVELDAAGVELVVVTLLEWLAALCGVDEVWEAEV
jgi:hypothetical protein